MRDWSPSGDFECGEPRVHAEMKEVFEGASILVVEDDEDTRDLLITLLQMAGYSATACATAESGLQALREATFDLVLTDYALPNRTGGWLLQQASDEGLLDATPALVVTAHPTPADTRGFEIVQKPFDFDDLVGRVRVRLQDSSSGRSARAPVRTAGPQHPGDGQTSDCPEPIELILYVNAASPRSANALENIKRVLSRYRSGSVRLTICDLHRSPRMPPDGGSASTPARAPRSRGARTFILGHASSQDVVLELLDGCGLQS